jgi:amidase
VPTSFGRVPTGTGALDGRTFVVKDLFAVAGHVSSYGTARWRDTHEASATTAPAVERLLAAGAELVGMAKLDSLAYSLVGNAGEGAPPRNPRWPDRFTGGSSSGPASAVAGGLADLGLGSDTAGSMRVPAAACGLCSIRPTHATIASGGMLPLAPSFDTAGLFAREPRLLADAHAVLVDARAVLVDARDASTVPRSEVLLAVDPFEWIDADAADAVARTAEALASELGCPLRHADLRGFTSEETAARFARLQGREVWAHHGPWIERNLDCFLDEVRIRLERCREFADAPRPEQEADRDAWARYRGALAQVVGPATCVVLPVLHDLPPRRTASDAALVTFRSACFRLTAPSSLTGSPEVVVPVHHDRSGNSYGVGLLGAPGTDRALLDAAARLDAAGVLDVWPDPDPTSGPPIRR